MVRPSAECIQAPSRIEPTIEIGEEAFNAYASTAKSMPVSFEDDGVSNPQDTTVYLLPSAVETEGGNVDIWPGRYIVAKKED